VLVVSGGELVAWMRMMGAASVNYHRETVLGRGDDHPGQALDYYASRGETPLVWGGAGAFKLGLTGPVTEADYDKIYGPGGACDPLTGRLLVAAKRPGLELVVAAHKSVALLGVIGRAEDMHAILDVETDATMAALDAWMAARGGRRGRTQTRTKTHGLTWAVTRHATSRAGDPEPHDHVLIANICRMADEKGGWKAVDTAALRDILHAATAAGRVASAAKAVELGYAIEADHGPSGRLGHWRIAGVPVRACELFSKRSAEISASVESHGFATYQARQTAARDTRKEKRHTPPGDLIDGWHEQLGAAGWTPESLLDLVGDAGRARPPVPARLSAQQLAALAAHTLGPDGRLAEIKVFTRSDVIVAVAPLLFGRHPGELARAVDAVCAHPDAIPLVGVAAARERAYAPACVLAAESAIAEKIARQARRDNAPVVADTVVAAAMAAKEETLGRALTAGQRAMVTAVCTSGRGAELVLGVAGAGKTTALDVARAAFETAGFRVIGTSTSGQAARTLGREAGIEEARTMASLLWRLDHGRLHLDQQTIVILDEAGMADDPSVLRLLSAAETAGAKTILVGDHRQLGAVGPGGTLEAVIARHTDAVHTLDENVRQADPAERQALAELRAGEVEQAIDWYQANDRIRVAPDRDRALAQMVNSWAADVAAGRDAAMYAWRRANVAALNSRARTVMAAAGKLTGPELRVDGQTFQAGDRIVTLAPGTDGQTVTSERGSVVAVDVSGRSLAARMDDGRSQNFGPEEATAGRLAHGYATTVHRSQGSTIDVAHLFADGGGRELGYVAMSRARTSSHVHLVADNVAQAVEDLARDWSAERRQIWAIDCGTPEQTDRVAAHPLEVEAAAQTPAQLKAALGRARLAAERAALVTNLKAAAGAEGVDHIPPEAVERVQRLDRHIRALNQRLAPAPPPTPGVVRVPPAYQPHHTPPPPQPGGPTPGL
jgi:conjugative relaxase-like TrwC/TraI family protein